MYSSCAIILLASIAINLVSADVVQYSIKKGNKACLIAQVDAAVVVQYKTKDGTMDTARIDLPPASSVAVGGACASTKDMLAMLIVSFNETKLTLNFTDTEKGEVALSGVEFEYNQDSDFFPNASATGPTTASKTDTILTMGNDKQFFQCHSLIKAQINKDVGIEFASMKVQAFNVDNDFSKDASICPQDAPSTTVSPVTPTPSPTLPPTPVSGNWSVKADNGSVCIVAHMAVRFLIPYVKTDESNATAVIDIPISATSDNSMCGNETQVLRLNFYNNWHLEMMFTSEKAAVDALSAARDEYSVHNISLTYYHTTDLFPGTDTNSTTELNSRADGLDLFRAGMGMSFICQSKQAEALSNNVTMDTYSLHVQAFKYDNDTKFVGTVMECPTDSSTDSIVPIAVGAALAALVAIVLVAYIIGRKRSRTGYESV